MDTKENKTIIVSPSYFYTYSPDSKFMLFSLGHGKLSFQSSKYTETVIAKGRPASANSHSESCLF